MSKQKTNNQQQQQGAPQYITAAAWRAKATSESDIPTIPLELPSGAVVEVRRPPLEAWVASGRLPEILIKEFLLANPASDGEAQDAAARAAASLAQDSKAAVEMLQALRHLVTWSVVRPRIVEGAQGDDEIEPRDVPDKDFMYIIAFALSGAPQVPVKTVNGEVSVATLSNFRKGREGRASAGVGDAEP